MLDAHHFLATLAIVLCVAAVTTILFQRLRQPVVLGYLLAGMLVGPNIPVPLFADPRIIQTLSELGVILLMFSLGIEFSFQKLLRVGPTAGLIALVQCSLMIWLGYLIGDAFGWTRLESLYAGSVIAISSTTIIIKAFHEQRVRGSFTELVFGVLIVEDLVAILLITILTTLSAGEQLTALELARTAGELSLFLVLLVTIGLLVVPRLMRAVVALDRPETTVVASVGLAFGVALLALTFGYSVALGAFLAGSLVAESGVEHAIEHAVQPVRDMFAALFFVSVGMLIDPALIAQNWLIVLVFFVVVVVGKVVSVTLGAFLTGQTIQNSVKTGMSLAQIGEFSFILAGVGLATDGENPTFELLYTIAVAVSAMTTLLTPFMIRVAEPCANFVDRKLPRALQTFVAFYGSWVERLKTGNPGSEDKQRVKRLVRWLAVDTIVVIVIIVGAAVEQERLSAMAQQQFGWNEKIARLAVLGGAILVSSPFWISILKVVRSLGMELAGQAFPATSADKIDTADAARRLLVVTLQLAIVALIGAPVLAITQPFVAAPQGAIIFGLLLALLAFTFWRRATNLQGHTRAAAQIIAESLAQQTRDGRQAATETARPPLDDLLSGLGSPVSIQLPADSPVVGKTLTEINLRGLTGATVLAIRHGEDAVLVPAGQQRLAAGDYLALTGTSAAVRAAEQLLLGQADHDSVMPT